MIVFCYWLLIIHACLFIHVTVGRATLRWSSCYWLPANLMWISKIMIKKLHCIGLACKFISWLYIVYDILVQLTSSGSPKLEWGELLHIIKFTYKASYPPCHCVVSTNLAIKPQKISPPGDMLTSTLNKPHLPSIWYRCCAINTHYQMERGFKQPSSKN